MQLPPEERTDAGAVEEKPRTGPKKAVKWNSDNLSMQAQISEGRHRDDMGVVRRKLGCSHDVSEFYSPPRVVKMATLLGMKGGISLDLTVPGEDGYVWDFSK